MFIWSRSSQVISKPYPKVEMIQQNKSKGLLRHKKISQKMLVFDEYRQNGIIYMSIMYRVSKNAAIKTKGDSCNDYSTKINGRRY